MRSKILAVLGCVVLASCGATIVARRILNQRSIEITSPVPFQVFQRDGSNRADIIISGAYNGDPQTIQASFNGGEFQPVARATEGRFSGVLWNQPAGQGRLILRLANFPEVTASQDMVGIGDVLVPMGQSNAEGRVTEPQRYEHPTLKASVFDQTLGWRELTDPTDSTLPDQYSLWPLLATSIMADQNVPVAFITTGAPKTGLIGDGATWAKPGVEYSNAVAQIKACGANGIKAVLWHGGESDAIVPTMTQAQYEQAFLSMRNNMAADLRRPDLKFVVAQLGYLRDAGQSLTEVRAAQAHLPQLSPHILAGPVLADLDISQAAGGDGIHIRKPEHARIVAGRWWQAMKGPLYGSASNR